MAKYVCPICKKNEDIVETVTQIAEYRGKFNDVGEVEDAQYEITDTTTDIYFCVPCQEEFSEPLKIEDEES